MNGYDFAADTSKLDNVITDLESEKVKMETAITNIYDIIIKMNDNWEGITYNSLKTGLLKYQDGLNATVTMVDKIISILNSNKSNAEEALNKIKKIYDSEE